MPTDPFSPLPSSRLLLLPREIRDQIWSYVLCGDGDGNNNDELVHIVNLAPDSLDPREGSITHVLCRAPISDVLAQAMDPYDAAYKNRPHWDAYRRRLPPGQSHVDWLRAPFLHEQGLVRNRRYLHHVRQYVREWGLHHRGCYKDAFEWTGGDYRPEPQLRPPPRRQLRLSVMRTCRTVYAETFAALWGGTCFALSSSSACDFVAGRTRLQAESIRHVALRTDRWLTLAGRTWEAGRLQMADQRHLMPDSMLNVRLAEAFAALPNLESVYLAAGFVLTRKEAEAVWLRGKLEFHGEYEDSSAWEGPEEVCRSGDPEYVSVVDDIAAKPKLVFFHGTVERICVPLPPDRVYPPAMTPLPELRQDLADLLCRRILHGKGRRSGGGYRCGCSGGARTCCSLDLDEGQMEARRRTWESWATAGRFSM